MASVSPRITPLAEARRFMIDCFKAVQTCPEHAEIVAENLLEADYRGHYSHGMNRLDMYIRDIESGDCLPNERPQILKEGPVTALVDGRNGLGAVIGQFCMQMAIEKAKTSGLALVVAKGSNHYGIAGKYSLQALESGLIGLSGTNTSPLMAPTRAKNAALGTNPLAFGAPGLDNDNFVLDMATTAVAVGKIELAGRKNATLPDGWAMNDDGKVENDPKIAYKSSKLFPLGGTELNSGYKGFGLGMMIEILCGILSGAHFGPFVRKWGQNGVQADLGQFFMAINPEFFALGFEERLSTLMDSIRCMEPSDPNLKVLVAGDPEKLHMEKVHKDGGLQYVQNQHDTNKKLADKYNLEPMK